MEEMDLQSMVAGFKNKAVSQKAQTVQHIQEALQLDRKSLLNLSLQEMTQLMTGLLEVDTVQTLSRNGERIAVRDIIAKAPRKERKDKGVPRKKADAYLVDAEGNDTEALTYEGTEPPPMMHNEDEQEVA